MARCESKALMPRKLRYNEVLNDIEQGRYRETVLDVHYCIHPRRHRGGHEYRSSRWIITREIVRVAVILAIAGAVVIIGSLDSPILH